MCITEIYRGYYKKSKIALVDNRITWKTLKVGAY